MGSITDPPRTVVPGKGYSSTNLSIPLFNTIAIAAFTSLVQLLLSLMKGGLGDLEMKIEYTTVNTPTALTPH